MLVPSTSTSAACRASGALRRTIDGAENSLSIYQGYQGLSNRTFVDPDFIGGIDITKGSDAASWGNAGAVAMRTINADDIVKPGENGVSA